MIIPITNESKNFYAHLGQVFGSREVQKVTGDRFYDDEGKVWYLFYNRGIPDAFVSVKDYVIKNVWTENQKHLVYVLREIKSKVGSSTVPRCFIQSYKEAEYTVEENGSKNFVTIVGDYVEKN